MISETLSYLMQFKIIPLGLKKIFHMPWASNEVLNTIVFYNAWIGEPTPFLEHSMYAVLLATISSILLYKFFTSKETNFLINLNLLFFTTISFNLFFIGGRLGYILYFFLILYLIYLSIKHNLVTKKYIFIVLSISFSIVALMYLNGGLFKKRVDLSIRVIKDIQHTKTYDINTSVGQRYEMTMAGIELIKKHPIFGVGTADQLSSLRDDPNNKNNIIQKRLDIHNQYLDILMQFGLIGFLIYLYYLYKIIKFKPLDDERSTIKNITMIAMIWTGFWGTFTYFLPVFFSAMIIISSANKKILNNNLKQTTLKEFYFYILLAILSYTYEQLQ